MSTKRDTNDVARDLGSEGLGAELDRLTDGTGSARTTAMHVTAGELTRS